MRELLLKDKRRTSGACWIEFEWLSDDLDIDAEDGQERIRLLLDSAQARELYEYLKAKYEQTPN